MRGEDVQEYARFVMDGTYDGDVTMRCTDCGVEVDLWTWQENHSLVDYLASADAHNAARHGQIGRHLSSDRGAGDGERL